MESDAPPALVPGGLVANRMLEEDPPRYTRASDPCEPCVMGKHGTLHCREIWWCTLWNWIYIPEMHLIIFEKEPVNCLLVGFCNPWLDLFAKLLSLLLHICGLVPSVELLSDQHLVSVHLSCRFNACDSENKAQTNLTVSACCSFCKTWTNSFTLMCVMCFVRLMHLFSDYLLMEVGVNDIINWFLQ